MDDAHLDRLVYANLYPFYELMAAGAPTSRLERFEGVTACIVPAVAQRSFMNAVLYEDAAALEPVLDRLAAIYDAAGVAAWTVWVHPGDEAAAGVLERAGHTLDARPVSMGMPLAGWEPPDASDVEVGPIDVGDVTRINDAAYGWNDEFTHGLLQAPEGLRLYGAQVDGEPAACAAWLRHADDCAVYMVACLPAAQGRGLASELMRRMLCDGNAEGCTTTTLQASPSGYPIYLRLGYRDLGRLEMWERRR
jgi:ribosomal protein S18 acetylase RimI-like enzyme